MYDRFWMSPHSSYVLKGVVLQRKLEACGDVPRWAAEGSMF